MRKPVRYPVFDGEEPNISPSDPCVTWGSCVYATNPDEGYPVTVRGPLAPARATIQRRAADVIGTDFNDIAVLARWGRLLSRQDVWDSGGSERWEDRWKEKEGVGWYFRPGAYYRDDEAEAASDAGGEIDFSKLTPVEPPPTPVEPPPEWLPEEDQPVWEFCTPYDPGATPIYIVEER